MSIAPEFHGIYPYLVTPLDQPSGRIRSEVLARLVEHLVAQGVHGLSPLGSTGEAPYLSFEQRVEAVRTVVDSAAGRVPVVPGVSTFTTADAIHQAETFLKLGADGLVLILNSYFPLSRQAVTDFFRTVARSVPCPIVLYTNPKLGGVDLTPEIVIDLCSEPNIQYFKDATGNTGRLLTIVNAAAGGIKLFSASAHIPLFVLQLGGVGWMSGPACIVPSQCVRLYELARAGLWEEAFAAQKQLWRINEVFQKFSLAACVKTGLQLQGFDVGEPVAPQMPLGAQARAEIAAVLRAAGDR